MRLVTLDGAAAGRLAEVHASAFDRPWSAADLAELIASPGTVLLAAEDKVGAPPLGFVLVRALAGEAEVLTLAVSPAARRQGIGLALVEAAAGGAQALGAESIWLEVAQDNEAAIGLYGRAGFVTTGRRPGYYARTGGGRADALVMRRLLNSADA